MADPLVCAAILYLAIGLTICVADTVLYGAATSKINAWIVGVTLWPYVAFRAYRKVRDR